MMFKDRLPLQAELENLRELLNRRLGETMEARTTASDARVAGEELNVPFANCTSCT